MTPNAATTPRWAYAAAIALGVTGCRAPEGPLERFAHTPSDPTHVRFVAVGDTGKDDVGRAKVVDAMQSRCASVRCDFALLLGDLIYPGGATSASDPAIQRLVVAPFGKLGVPVYGVVGNHDEDGGFRPERAAHLTTLPSQEVRVRRSFALDAGAVTVVGVDTSGAMFGRPNPRGAIRAALDQAAGFRVAIGHHPRLSKGRHGDAGTYDGLPSFFPVASGHSVKALLDDTVCGRADLYLSGHDHSLQWLGKTCRGTQLVVAGGGSTTTAVDGEERAHFAASELGFAFVDATSTGARVELVKHDGEVLYTRLLPRR